MSSQSRQLIIMAVVFVVIVVAMIIISDMTSSSGGYVAPISSTTQPAVEAEASEPEQPLEEEDIDVDQQIDELDQQAQAAAEQALAEAEAEIEAIEDLEVEMDPDQEPDPEAAIGLVGRDDNTELITLEISCAALLADLSILTQAKQDIIPADGIIMAAGDYNLGQGENLLDLLKRVLGAASIDLEHNNSGQIIAINNLANLDGGVGSAWVCLVNGEALTGNLADYLPLHGDYISWQYWLAD